MFRRRDGECVGDEARSAQFRVGACVAACWLRKGGMTSMWAVFQSSGFSGVNRSELVMKEREQRRGAETERSQDESDRRGRGERVD